MCPEVVKGEVERLRKLAVDVHLLEANGQCYVLVRATPAPQPPWNASSFDILIAIPAAYDGAELDGFYIALPYAFDGGQHPRVNGPTITIEGRQWQMVSWHYPDDKHWRRGRDTLESHIAHCRGFFLNRGSVNAY